MKKAVTFASPFRVKAALCCSVAVLLSACGGSTDDLDSQQSLAATTASEAMDAPSAAATGAVVTGPEAPVSIAQETATPDAATQASDSGAAAAAPGLAPMPAATGLASAEAADPAYPAYPAYPANPATPAAANSAPASNEFNLSGYQDAPAASSSDAASLGTTAASSADGQQATPLPAA